MRRFHVYPSRRHLAVALPLAFFIALPFLALWLACQSLYTRRTAREVTVGAVRYGWPRLVGPPAPLMKGERR